MTQVVTNLNYPFKSARASHALLSSFSSSLSFSGQESTLIAFMPKERFSEIVVFILKALFQQALLFCFSYLVALSAPM